MAEHVDLDQWDREYKPHLNGIELDAGWIGFYAKKIEERTRKLPAKPQWATKAESELNIAVEELERALARLKTCRDMFYALKTELH